MAVREDARDLLRAARPQCERALAAILAHPIGVERLELGGRSDDVASANDGCKVLHVEIGQA